MKITLFVLISLAVAFASAESEVAPRGLQEDFNDFLSLVNLKQVKRVALKYYATDKETKQFVKYLKGDTFGAVWDQVFTNEDVRSFLKYVQDSGVDVQSAVNQVAKFLKHPLLNLEDLTRKPNKGLKNLVKEVLELVPLDDFKTLFDEKMQSSEEFKHFYETVANFDYQAMKEFVANSPELLDLFETLKSYDLDVDGFVHGVEEFFGWN